jgi:hypothetical protein
MKKTLTEAAQAAKAIKQELKKTFPGIKFSVRSDNFSMGDSVHIGWTDGPTVKQVDTVVDKYQYGHFNGMEDIYENSNNRNDLPQAKFVMADRKISEERYQKELEILKKDYNGYENATVDSYVNDNYVYTTIYRRLVDQDLSKELVKK